jgi:hypothetical protein
LGGKLGDTLDYAPNGDERHLVIVEKKKETPKNSLVRLVCPIKNHFNYLKLITVERL